MSLSLPPAEPGSPGGAAPGGPGAFAMAWAGARRRWFLAGLTGLLLGGAAAAAYYTQTPQKYTVATTLQIVPREALLAEREVPNGEIDYRRAQAALVRTRPVLLKALETQKVRESSLLREQQDPAGWLETEIKTSTLDGGQVRVSLTGERPDELAATLNAVTAAYLTLIVDAEETQRRARIDELDKVLASSEDRVRKQKAELRGLADALKTSPNQTPTFRQQTVLLNFSGLQREWLAVESQLRVAEAQTEVLKMRLAAANKEPVPAPLVAEAVGAEPEVRHAAEDVGRAQAALDQAKGTIQEGSAAHAQLVAAVADAEKRLGAAKEEKRAPVAKRLRDALIRQAAGAVEQQEVVVRGLELQRAKLKTQVEEAKQEVEKFGTGSYELEAKQVEIAEAEGIMRKLRGEKERLAIEMQTYKRRVNVSSPADAAAARPAASAVTAAVGLGVAGFALGALGVGYLESRRRRLVHSGDVALAMRLRVLGNLPHVPALASGPLTGVWDDRFGLAGTLLVEAVTDLRAMLLASVGRPPQVVMVTSSAQGEGKTTLACLLALSLAQIGKRTLLVDADLRNPRVAERLDLPPAAGLGEVLRGEARPAGVIGGVPGTPLAVMTVGRPCPTIIRGLSEERVRKVFAELREQFDYVIVDSCPTPLADGLVVGACADAAVLVVRSGYSEEPVVREACQRLLAARVPLVGGVLNGLPLDRRWLRYPYAAVALPPAQAENDLPVAEPA